MASSQQPTLEAFTAGTTEETVTQTVVAPLETSNIKRQKVESVVNEFAEMCSYMGDMMASIPPHERSPMNSTLYRLLTDEFPGETRLSAAKVVLSASRHVAAAHQSAQALGGEAELPTFGDEQFFMLDSQQFELSQNERGYGLKARFIPYDPVWFHINPRPFVQEHVERICDGDASPGTAELRLEGDDGVSLHLPVSWDVEVFEPAEVNTSVGVDIGENVIYAAAVVDGSGDVADVEMQRGDRFRHYRTELQQRRDRLQEKGDLRGVRQTRGDQERYTEQVLDTASQQIVDKAVEHAPSVIKIEDLTHYRTQARDPIHDWPFALLQEKIAYKAKAAGIPVQTVDPAHSSVTCRQCGQTDREYRDGSDFECRVCGYTVHADVNAAINLANSVP